MSEKTVLIVNAVVNPHEKEALAHYQKQAGALLGQAGARPLGKFKIADQIAGSTPLHMTVVMEFSSSEHIKAVFESEAYKALLPYRDKAFQAINIYIGAQ